MSTTEQGWVDKKTIAAHLKVSTQTVDRWVDEKGMPSSKPDAARGGARRFSVADVDEWMRSRNGGDD